MEPSDPGLGQIGRYLLAGRLGSGGMGEVFLAWDDQLKRHVAIKRIRQDAGLSFQQRERFFCEAQQTASVSHPNVVQIFDLLCDDEAIVMEYIEGRTLAERLATGRLETAQVLRLALEIARGLAAAHDAGLVHRDLKAANVLITRTEEHAKIVDFGLARPVVREPGDPGLTRQGTVMGTPHAMSPEQVRGEVVDQRSDLFSFGSLLHEMLTGRPPFRGTDEFDSQWKVLHEEPVHPLTARKDLPSETADLLLRLLKKDRQDRPDSAHEVIEILEGLQIASSAPRPVVVERSVSDLPTGEETILELPERPHRDRTPAAPVGRPRFWTRSRLWTGAAVLLVLAAAVLYLAFRPARPLRVAVILRSDPKDSELVPAATRIQSAAQAALASLERVTPIAHDEVIRAGSELTQVAKAVSPDEFLRISVKREGGLALVTLERIAARDEELRGSSQPFNVSPNRESWTDLARVVISNVQEVYGDRVLAASKDVLSSLNAMNDDDYASFLDIRERVEDGQALPEDLARLEAMMIINPERVEMPLLAARIALFQFLTRREPDDLTDARRLVRYARRLAPEDIPPLRLELQVALARYQPGEAETILEELERLDPSDLENLPLQADLAEKQGHPKEAMKLLNEAVEQAPSWQNHYLLATLAARNGRIDVARKQIADILAQARESVWAREALGNLELTYGDLAEAERIYQGLVDSASERASSELEFEGALSNLGAVHVLRGRFAEAAALYSKVLDAHPDHVNSLVGLAEVEIDKDSSAALYHRALKRLSEIETGAGLLPGEALLKAQCLARLGRAPDALAILKTLGSKIEDDPLLLYQRALVRSLAGEPASAVTDAKAALERGISPHLFNGSDFQELRADPELRFWFRKTS